MNQAGSIIPVEGVVQGENLAVMRQLPSESIDLIYIDPPFGTGQVRRLQSIRTGTGDKVRNGFGGRTYNFEVVSAHNYRDDMPIEEYLGFLYTRLVEMHRLLTHDGSLYLHLDFHTVHFARLMLDEIFGPERFLNEIIWAYDYGGRARDRWARKHDNILWYTKSDRWSFNREEIDRIPYLAPGMVGAEKAARGKLPTDTWWMTIVPTNSKERTGYPTQKPVKLLERIVRASSDPGELVADFFGGSGTTGVAAKRLGRRFILVDENPVAIQIAEKRLAAEAEPSPSLFEDAG
ncbi:MAG: site-specific DNA-methyltransferase [Actinomycetota bacterium]|nr:site-specific DNA-methyltransferase [Actinomycetota bacterium]